MHYQGAWCAKSINLSKLLIIYEIIYSSYKANVSSLADLCWLVPVMTVKAWKS